MGRPLSFQTLHWLTHNTPSQPCVTEPIDIAEPPCKRCKFWNPRRTTDVDGNVVEVRLCWAESQWKDFGCFRERLDGVGEVDVAGMRVEV